MIEMASRPTDQPWQSCWHEALISGMARLAGSLSISGFLNDYPIAEEIGV